MLAIITVNYNCARHTLELLRSLERQDNKQFSVIVVDNDSQPEDRALLGEYAASSSLNLDIIYSETNRGFSGGNNLAIRKALAQGSEWLLLLNPDTIASPDLVRRIQQTADDEMAIWQFPLAEPHGRTAYAGLVQWLKPTLKHLDHWPLARSLLQHHRLYAIGAALLVHRHVFEHVGMLDEHYFLYFEDADFSMRAHKLGIPVKFAREPMVRHGVSKSTSTLGSPLLLRYHARNALLFNKNHGPWWVQAALPVAAVYGIIFQFTKTILLPSRQAPSRAIMDGIIDFYAHRFGKIKDTA
jgi:GT2 family glycosyltransferase